MPPVVFIAPYAQEQRRSAPRRWLPFYNQCWADILADGGWATEAEIDGDRALIFADVSKALAKTIATSFEVVEDPTTVWTKTRKKPQNANGEVAFGAKRSPCRSIEDAVAEATGQRALMRTAEALITRADKEGYVRLDKMQHAEMCRLLAIVGGHGYGLDRISGGTFPTTGLLDQFNRAAIGATWTTPMYGFGGALQIVSSTLLGGVNADDDNSGYLNTATYGPAAEAYITFTTKDAGTDVYGPQIFVRVAAGIDAYAVGVEPYAAATDNILKQRIDNDVPTQLGADIAQEVAAGEKFGIEMVGSTLTPHHYTGGAWYADTPSTDATYSAAGYIGVYCPSNVIRLDDLGGGTRIVSIAVGQASETDSAQSFGRLKSKAIGLAAETDSALAMGRLKSRAVGLAEETDSALAIGRLKSKALGIALEIDEALAITAGSATPVAEGLHCFIEFTADPKAETAVWTEVTPYLRSCQTRTGRSKEFDQMETGSFSGVFDNSDRRFEMNYDDSPHYPYVVPRRRLWLAWYEGGVYYGLWYGVIDDFPLSWEGSYSEVTITANDLFALLATYTLTSSYPAEKTGARIDRVLTELGFPASARSLATGQTTLPAIDLSSSKPTALAHLLDVNQTENGRLFCDGEGRIVFRERHETLKPPFNTPQATFDDQGLYIDYASPIPESEPIYNTVNVTLASGAVVTASDGPSIAAYYPSSYDRSLLINDPSEGMDCANFLLGQYKDPRQTIRSMTIEPSFSDAARAQAYTRTIGDRVRVIKHPPPSGDAFDQELLIEAREHVFDAIGSANPSWTTRYELSAASTRKYWILGTSALNVDARLAY